MSLYKSKEVDVNIRMAKREDCAKMLELKRELRAHHGRDHLPLMSVEAFARDGFDVDPPCYQCLLAEIPDPECDASSGTDPKWKVIGYAFYFYAYVTWVGKVLYLEDLCVSKGSRGKGIGSILMKQLAKVALEEKCFRIQLQVSKLNESGQRFYDMLGGCNSTKVEGWHNFRLDKEAIKRLVGQEN